MSVIIKSKPFFPLGHCYFMILWAYSNVIISASFFNTKDLDCWFRFNSLWRMDVLDNVSLIFWKVDQKCYDCVILTQILIIINNCNIILCIPRLLFSYTADFIILHIYTHTYRPSDTQSIFPMLLWILSRTLQQMGCEQEQSAMC